MDYYKLKVLNNKKKIFIAMAILLVIGSLVAYYFLLYQKNDEMLLFSNDKLEDEIKDDDKKIVNNNSIYVDIKGYVNKPGVYSFLESDNARVNDLIIKAGGLKKEADTSVINLSKKLEDEMAIIIYSKSEIDKASNGDDIKKKLEICENKLQNNACIENKELSNNNLININTATKDELMTLQGIGESKALSIIEYRTKNSFKSISDIKLVEGIGESLFESIKNNIKV